MFNSELENKIKEYFPAFNLKFKNESLLMRLLGYVLFFNKNFMTNYTTTIGSTVYFPNSNLILEKPNYFIITLMHELVHIYDANKFSYLLFSFLYLTPQILVLLWPLLLFLISWKIVLFSMLLCILPIPSYFRMHFEKRAYLVSLYAMHYLNEKGVSQFNLELCAKGYLSQFKGSGYYFMWVFDNLDNEFDLAIQKIKQGKRPYEDAVFDVLDKLLILI